MINKSAEFCNKYLELVDKNETTLDSSSSSSSASSCSLRSQSLTKMSAPTRATLYDLDQQTNVNKVNEVLDTCLLERPKLGAAQTLSQEGSSFTCKICLNKFHHHPHKPANAQAFSSSSLDAPYLGSSSSLTSLESNCLSSVVTSRHEADASSRLFQIESCKCKFCASVSSPGQLVA